MGPLFLDAVVTFGRHEQVWHAFGSLDLKFGQEIHRELGNGNLPPFVVLGPRAEDFLGLLPGAYMEHTILEIDVGPGPSKRLGTTLDTIPVSPYFRGLYVDRPVCFTLLAGCASTDD